MKVGLISRLLGLFKTGTAIVISETLLMSAFAFGTFAVLTRLVDLETIGLWVLLNSLLNFARIADFWSNGMSSFIGEALGQGDRDKASRYVCTAALTGVAGYSAILLCAIPMLYFLSDYVIGRGHKAEVLLALPIMALTFWMSAMSGVYQAGFLGFGRPIFKFIQNVGGSLVFFCGALLFAKGFGLQGILLAQCAQAAAMFLFGLIIFHRKIIPGFGVLAWDRSLLGKMARFGSKALALGLFQLAIEPIIRMLTNWFGGLSSVAIVDLAARLIAAARGVIAAIGTILVPRFAKLIATDRKLADASFQEAQTLFILLSLAIFAILISAFPLIGVIMLPTAAGTFSIYALILSLGWLANIVTMPVYLWLFASRQLKVIFNAHVIMALGALQLGALGGLAFGDNGMLGGCAAALLLSSAYLVWKGQPEGSTSVTTALVRHLGLAVLLPTLLASLSLLIIWSGILAELTPVLRFIIFGLPIPLCALACLKFGQVHAIPDLVKGVDGRPHTQL